MSTIGFMYWRHLRNAGTPLELLLGSYEPNIYLIYIATLLEQSGRGTRLIAEPNGKKIRDWAIRREVS